MLQRSPSRLTLVEVGERIGGMDLPEQRRRDMRSAIRRICEMMNADPAALQIDVEDLRRRIGAIRPAAFGISAKTLQNLRSNFAAALELAGILDPMERGLARKDPIWGALLEPLPAPSRFGTGLAAFANWCVVEAIAPDEVDDEAVRRFQIWLETRTLHPDPRSTVRRVPRLWNEAGSKVPGWPGVRLSPISFRPASQHLRWQDLPAGFRADAEAYLAMRRELDLFDILHDVPKRALAQRTLRQQQEHIRLTASILLANNMPIDALASLATPEALKAVLRHYHGRAEGRPSAFAVTLAKTIVDVARYHVKVGDDELKVLKAIAAKLPPIPFEMVEKNKALLRKLEDDRTKARLLHFPARLLGSVQRDLERKWIRFVDAQVAIAVDILLIAPLRPQNLIALDWSRHFQEPNGPGGKLILYIPKAETKSGKRELVFELPEDVSERLRWYRRNILPRLRADMNGPLFVTGTGAQKGQACLTKQLTEIIEREVGLQMTPHQFRHVAAMLFLEEHPEAFQVVSDLLGHSWAKTTLVYAGSSSRRASRAYGKLVEQKRDALHVKAGRPTRRVGRK